MKKNSTYLMMAIICTFLVGCLANEGAHNGKLGDTDQTNNDYPIAYNTKQEEKERQGTNLSNETPREREHYLEGYQTDLDKPGDQNSNYSNSFYNQDSETIAREVNKLDEVDISQAIVTDERIIVSAMLNQNEYSDNVEEVVNKIHDRVAQAIPNKEVIVYTDAIYWNQMRDLNSRLRNTDDPDETKNHINDFFKNTNN